MKKYQILFLIFFVDFFGCKEKKMKPEESAISATSIIRGQIHHLDTSYYQIMKYVTRDGITDTSYLKREDVKEYAKAFLELPDISEKNLLRNYSEERIIDAAQNTLSIIYSAKDEKQEIQKEIIIVNLNDLSSGKVQSIYIDRFSPSKDDTIQQHLFWQIDKFFQVGEIIQKENDPEKIRLIKITWQ